MAAASLNTENTPPLRAPQDSAFLSGLRNIRRAIEGRLATLGVREPKLGDTAGHGGRFIPSMVIIDVAANGVTARVTLTRDEIEDCVDSVHVFCVQRKIDHLAEQFRG